MTLKILQIKEVANIIQGNTPLWGTRGHTSSSNINIKLINTVKSDKNIDSVLLSSQIT